MGEAILGWGTADGASSRRPALPWRSTRDPWAVLVSEVMAQQTQLARVVVAYPRFLARFPTPGACAASALGDVLRAWQGLGYNRRARDLHRAAAVIVSEHAGRVPAGLRDLLSLPGVGAYTARAVMAFAFEADVGVVDTNAGRVLSRAVAGRRLPVKQAQQLVDAMVPAGKGWAFGQALLDLGATVCVAGDPCCRRCPVRPRCRWASTGSASPDPAAGSAGVSTPKRPFDGSDRQGRGRLVDALRHGPLSARQVIDSSGWPGDPDRVAGMVAGLVEDGLVVRDRNGTLRLP
jgi:A/G-specific adenine glycosylase